MAPVLGAVCIISHFGVTREFRNSKLSAVSLNDNRAEYKLELSRLYLSRLFAEAVQL